MSLTSIWHMVLGDGPDAAVARAELAAEVTRTLRAGASVTDSMFDGLFPWKLRRLSRVHWSPVEVAMRCADLLAAGRACRVLDVGSGVGKMCAIGALTTPGHFTGVEQYPELVAAAREVCALLGASNTAFVEGFFSALDPADFDAFYFFNPFEENDWPTPLHQRGKALVARGTFEGGVTEARAFLRGARPGARIVTYNGMGGAIPDGYELVTREKLGCTIEVWARTSTARWVV